MFYVLSHKTYRSLFTSQIIGLIGTGLTTVALGLLAFDLAGERAGSVLGTALAIKMIAYVGLSPIMGALTDKFRRKPLLINLNILRGLIIAFLPFVSEVWQIYLIIFLMQAVSATYTPAFQALIPIILKEEERYTQALSLSRLSYDMENLLSPLLAASLLSVLAYQHLFLGTTCAFLIAVILVLRADIPHRHMPKKDKSFGQKVTQGIVCFWQTPRLRGLMGVNMAVAAAGAMVIVNTVVYVQHQFSLSEQHVAFALAAFGAGSMTGAFSVPVILKQITDRTAMLCASAVLIGAVSIASMIWSYDSLILLWALIGFAYATALTPIGRLLQRSSTDGTRASIYTAQFALSHLCWLVTYPIAGWVGATYGLDMAARMLAVLASIGLLGALVVWKRQA